MNECKHKWIFQETQKKTYTKCNNQGDWTARFYRTDLYYCENCCEQKKVEQEKTVRLPFGGTRHLDDFEPEWY